MRWFWRWKETNLFSRGHCLISALAYGSTSNDTAKVPYVISEGIFKCFIKFVITTHREISTTKMHEHEMWTWSCDFQHGLNQGYYQSCSLFEKGTVVIKLSDFCTQPACSTHSLLSYHDKTCNIPSQSQFNLSDSLVQHGMKVMR